MAVNGEKDLGGEVDLKAKASQVIDGDMDELAQLKRMGEARAFYDQRTRVLHELDFCKVVGLLSEEEANKQFDKVRGISNTPSDFPLGD
jgi:hypothetical protein